MSARDHRPKQRPRAQLPRAACMRTMLDHLGDTRASLSERYGVGVGTIGMRLTGAGLDEPGMRAKKQPRELTLLTFVGEQPDFPFALCAQTDPEAWFPEQGGSSRAAKRLCLGCEHREECLQWALDHDERFGVWGALTERERRKLKKPASRARTRADTGAEAERLVRQGLTLPQIAGQMGIQQRTVERGLAAYRAQQAGAA